MELQNFILNLEKSAKESQHPVEDSSIVIKTLESTARIELLKFLESIPPEELTVHDVDRLFERYQGEAQPTDAKNHPPHCSDC